MGHVRKPMSYAAQLAFAVAAVGWLAGCGQPTTPAPTAPGTVSVPIQPTITPLPTGPLDGPVDTTGASVSGLFDLGASLTTTSCTESGGVWSYSGTFVNPKDVQLHVTVAISLVASADMSLLTTKEIDYTVPARGTVQVGAKDFYSNAKVDATKVQCVTGVTDKDA